MVLWRHLAGSRYQMPLGNQRIDSGSKFRFGLFEADAAGGTLMRDGVRVKIQDQPFRVLISLLNKAGEIVTREELRQELWPDGTYVDFDGSLNAILKKLRAAIDDDSENPRFIETVPRRGYRFIAPVSVKKSAPIAVSREIAGGDESRTSARWTTKIVPNHRAAFVIAAGSVLVVVLFIASARFGWYRRVTGSDHLTISAQASAPIVVRKSVAVLGFHNVAGRPEDAWLGGALSEMLRTELAGGDRLRLVSGEDVANLRHAVPWPETDTFDGKTTARIGNALNSDVLVLGSYTVLGGGTNSQLRVDVRLQDAKTGEIISETAQTGAAQDLFRIVSRVGTELRDRLGVPSLGEKDEASVLASVPLDPDTARVYTLGLAKLRDSDASAARDLFQQAVKADPKFSLAHAMLARAYQQLGYEQKRREEAKKAWDLSADLPRAERMLVEGDYYQSLGDSDKAISVYHALFELFPDNVDYGLQFAWTQILAGRAAEARETLKRLRALPHPGCDDPRIDVAESRVSETKATQLALDRAAMKKAAAEGKQLVFAQARKEECLDLAYGDHPELAAAACEDAYRIYLAAGNPLGAADSLRLLGDAQGTRGHYTEAVATYQRALNVLHKLGEHEKTGAILNNMAINYENRGKLDQAERFFRQAEVHFDESGDHANSITALGNVADVLFLRGQLSAAEKVYQRIIEESASIQLGTGYTKYRLADLWLTEGRVQDARREAEEAMKDIHPENGNYQYLTGAMISRGEALEAAGDMNGARQVFQQVLDLRQKTGEAVLVAETQVELAQLDLEEGSAQEAESLLRPAINKFEAEAADPDTAGAYILLSRALSLQGKLGDARSAIQHAEKPSSTSSDPALKLPLAIQSARVEMAGARSGAPGRPSLAKARQRLQSTIATAKKLGYYQIECQARLALGQLLMEAKEPSAPAQLVALADEAHGHGLELIARQAKDAAVNSGKNLPSAQEQ